MTGDRTHPRPAPADPGSAGRVDWYIDDSARGDTRGRAIAAGDLDGDDLDNLAIVDISGDPGVIDIFYGGSTAIRTGADADARLDGPCALALGVFKATASPPARTQAPPSRLGRSASSEAAP